MRHRVDERYIDSLEGELPHWPGVSWRWDSGNKHPALVIFFHGNERRFGVPSTGSDQRGALNAIADVRRILRELGAARAPTPQPSASNQAPKPYRPPTSTRVAAPPLISEPRSGDGLGSLKLIQRSMTRAALARWEDVPVNQERLQDAATLLIRGWHPDIIREACKLITEATHD